MRLINLDALVAELDRRIEGGVKVYKESPSAKVGGLIQGYKNTKQIINSLDVKEVDLEKEAERFIFWLEKQGEHKPTDKVVPKFKVGDKVKSFIDGFECTIESIDNTCYYGDTTNFDIQDQDGWELVEQKPAWSEEDEDMLYKVTAILNRLCAKGEEFIWSPKTLEKLFYWLQNLKPQSHWKPSDRELGAILVAIGDEKQKGSDVAKELRNIYQQLKELKG